jgi:hypothetical protein
MRQLFKDPEIDAKFNDDCKAADTTYKASKAKAYGIYCKAVEDALDAAKAAQKAKETK